MILVTRLNDTKFYVNPHLIKFLEETPDTVITLVNDTKLIVKDKTEKIVEDIINYRTKINKISADELIKDDE
jgi:flagellar protein FlbD